MKNKTEYELLNENNNRRHPKCLFKTLRMAKKMRKIIVKNNPKLKHMLFIYKSWKEDGRWWGEALD